MALHGKVAERLLTSCSVSVLAQTSVFKLLSLLFCSVSVRASSHSASVLMISVKCGIVFSVRFRQHTNRKLDYYPFSQVYGEKKKPLMLL